MPNRVMARFTSGVDGTNTTVEETIFSNTVPAAPAITDGFRVLVKGLHTKPSVNSTLRIRLKIGGILFAEFGGGTVLGNWATAYVNPWSFEIDMMPALSSGSRCFGWFRLSDIAAGSVAPSEDGNQVEMQQPGRELLIYKATPSPSSLNGQPIVVTSQWSVAPGAGRAPYAGVRHVVLATIES